MSVFSATACVAYPELRKSNFHIDKSHPPVLLSRQKNNRKSDDGKK